MLKKRIVLLMLLIGLTTSISSCATKPETKQPENIRVWWGNAEDIKGFLDSPQAQGKRWVIEAVGE